MRRLLAVTAFGLAIAGPAWAEDQVCAEAMARVDTFGTVRWLDPYPLLRLRTMDRDCDDLCVFEDGDGVRYEILDTQITDKMPPAGTSTPWPWGLEASDGPEEVKAKLARLLPNEGGMNIRDGGPTYNLDVPGCGAWIEVTFAGERGIKAVSLNAQP